MTRKTSLPPLTALLAVVALAGCASTGSDHQGMSEAQFQSRQTIPKGHVRDPITLQPIRITPAEDYKDTSVRGMSENTIRLLVEAEISGHRGDLKRLLSDYTAVALETKDSAVIQRAFEAAQYMKDDPAALALATLWTDVAPDALEAHQHAAVYQLKAGDFSSALRHMERVMELGGQSTFDRLAVHAATLDPQTQDSLLDLYAELIERHPEEASLRFGHANLLAQRQQFEEAYAESGDLVRQHPDEANYVALHSKLMHKLEGADAALAYLKKQRKRLPKSMQIGVLLAQALLDEEQFEAAEKVYAELAAQFPKVPTLKRSYAIIALQNDNVEAARQALQSLVAEDKLTNDAHYYLGRIADQADEIDTAIHHYSQVTSGGNFVTALARSAFLLRNADRDEEASAMFAHARSLYPEQSETIWQVEISLYNETDDHQEALEVAERAVEEHPDSLDLKYSYAMTADRAGKIDVLERELREILEQDPDNAIALNALGYTLADRTDRLEEAESLIRRALEIDPANPAIMDSLGWLLYRKGMVAEALPYLEKAYMAFPDPEVAAHLGEVLWETGEEARAKTVWREGLTQDDTHKLLLETIQRYGLSSAQLINE